MLFPSTLTRAISNYFCQLFITALRFSRKHSNFKSLKRFSLRKKVITILCL